MRRAQGQRVLAVDGRAGAEGLAPAGRERAAVVGHRQHLRVQLGEPRRRRRGGGGEVDPDPGRVQGVHLLVEPGEVPRVGPAAGASAHEKTPEGDQVDPGLPHQRAVLDVGLAGPLLGVVVAAEGQRRQGSRHAITVATLTRQSQRFVVEKSSKVFGPVRNEGCLRVDGPVVAVTCCPPCLILSSGGRRVPFHSSSPFDRGHHGRDASLRHPRHGAQRSRRRRRQPARRLRRRLRAARPAPVRP